MVRLDSLTLRVNGRECSQAMFQLKIEDGYPGGKLEIIIVDSQIGEVVLNDNFTIEIQEAGSPRWKKTTVRDLIKLLRLERGTRR